MDNAAIADVLDAAQRALAVMRDVDRELRHTWGEAEGATPELTAAIDSLAYALSRNEAEKG